MIADLGQTCPTASKGVGREKCLCCKALSYRPTYPTFFGKLLRM